jgi:hypothetical protein
MRTNFSWLLGMTAVAFAAVVSVVATVWLLGLSPIDTGSSVLQAGADSRPAVFRAEALPRPHRTVTRRKPPVAQRPRAAAPVRVQLPYVQSATEPVHASPSTQAPQVAIWPQVVASAPVLAPAPVRPPAPALPTPVAPPVVPAAPAVPTPPASPAPEPTTPDPAPATPTGAEAELAAVAPVQTGKKTTGRDGRKAVPTKNPGSQPSPTLGPVRPTPHDGDHGDGGSSKPKLDSSEQQAKGDRHDKHSGD